MRGWEGGGSASAAHERLPDKPRALAAKLNFLYTWPSLLSLNNLTTVDVAMIVIELLSCLFQYNVTMLANVLDNSYNKFVS